MKRLILFIISALLLYACDKDFTEDNSIPVPEPGQIKRVELVTNAGEYALPEALRSGSADEYGVSPTPWVIVFHGSGDNAVFYEAVQSIPLGSKTYVNLTQTDSPCRVLIVANAPSTFNNGSSEVAFNAENLTSYFTAAGNYATAAAGFRTASLTSPVQTSVPYTSVTDPRPLLPMSLFVDIPRIDNTTTLGTVSNKLVLTRIVAKVTVECNDPNATLLGATVVGVPKDGTFIRNSSTVEYIKSNTVDYFAASGDSVTGISEATNNTTASNPIYLYESSVEYRSYVIVKMLYQGVVGYYKLAFKVSGTTDPTDVLRNKYYRFIINNINGPGYESLEQARSSLPVNVNISFILKVTDQVSYDISDNGHYYIGVSNSELNLYTDELDQNVLAFTVTTNAAFGIQGTIAVTSGSEFIQVRQSTINPAAHVGTFATTEVRIDVTNASPGQSIITLRVGNIIKNVIINKLPAIYSNSQQIEFTPNYVSGAISSSNTPWLKVSPDKINKFDKLDLTTPGTIYMMLEEYVEEVESGNWPPPGEWTRSGEVYFSRSDSQGRIKVILKQWLTIISPD